MTSRQCVDVLGKGASLASQVRALETVNLHRKDDLLFDARAFCQVSDVAAVNPVAPAAARRARRNANRTAGLNPDCVVTVVPMDDSLADRSERLADFVYDSVHSATPGKTITDFDSAEPIWFPGASHKVRKNHNYFRVH